MDSFWNAIATDNAAWMGIGSVLGGFVGAVMTFWVAEGKGFREGVVLQQKHHEEILRIQNGQGSSTPNEQERNEVTPAPEEIVEADEAVEVVPDGVLRAHPL